MILSQEGLSSSSRYVTDAAEIISQLADILVPGALRSISAEGDLSVRMRGHPSCTDGGEASQ